MIRFLLSLFLLAPICGCIAQNQPLTGIRPTTAPVTRSPASLTQSPAQWPQATPSLSDSVVAFLARFSARVQALGNPADSARWPRQQADLLALFARPDVSLPNLLVSRAVFQQEHPLTTASVFVQQLPRNFWQGFRLELNTKAARVQQVDTARHTIEIRVPVGLRGIRADNHQPQRVGEWWVMAVQFPARPDSAQTARLIAVSGTEDWLYADPLTRRKAQQIEKQLQAWLRVWINPGQPDSLRQQACGQLRAVFTTDTLFLRVTDKETRPLVINQCSQISTPVGPTGSKVSLVSFSLDFVTEIYAAPGGSLIGERTRLLDVTPSADTEFWYRARHRDPVPVKEGAANGGLSYWQVSQVTIQW